MALYGNKAGEPFDDINKVMKKIFIAAHKLGTRYWKDQGRRNFTDEQFEKHLEEMHKNEAIFWSGLDDVDEIKEEVDSIIEEVEKTCKSIIEKK